MGKLAVVYSTAGSYNMARNIARHMRALYPDMEVVLYRRAYPVDIKPPKEVIKWGADIRLYLDVDVKRDAGDIEEALQELKKLNR